MTEEAKKAEKAETSFWRSLFDDISIAQLLAGALAAVTSMLLASRIGIAGSVIGVAVGSIVSAVASQVYKKFLSASAEKIKDIAPGNGVRTHAARHRDASCGAASQNAEQTALLAGTSAAETVVLPAPAAHNGLARPLGEEGLSSAGAATLDAYAEAARARSRSARARKAKIQRNAVIVAAVSALAAIMLSAAAIELFTAGQGVGTRPEPLSAHAPWSAPAKDAPDSDADAAAGTGLSAGDSTSGAQGSQTGPGSSSQPDGATSQGSQAGSTDGSQSGSDSSDLNSSGQNGATGSGSQDSSSSGANGSHGSDSSAGSGLQDASGSGSEPGSSEQMGSAGSGAASSSS